MNYTPIYQNDVSATPFLTICITHTFKTSYRNRRNFSIFLYLRKWSSRIRLRSFSMDLLRKSQSSAFRSLTSKLVLLLPASSFHFLRFWSSPRPISDSQLHALLHFHLCPIYLVLFKGSYFLRMGYLILRGASRLDAFSVYPFRTWLPGRRLGSPTGTPAVRPSRSSRTKDSSSQISCARAG